MVLIRLKKKDLVETTLKLIDMASTVTEAMIHAEASGLFDRRQLRQIFKKKVQDLRDEQSVAQIKSGFQTRYIYGQRQTD